MTRADVLRSVETLTHAARVQQMIAFGQQARQDQGVRAALTAMERGDVYERYLTLQSCWGSGDGEHVVRAAADPSRTVRGLAIRLVPVVCDDAQVQRALRSLTSESRKRLAIRLAKRRRVASIDTWLGAVAAEGKRELHTLLPMGSAEVVVRHLASGYESVGLQDWRRLARFHPQIAAQALTRSLVEGDTPEERVVERLSAVLPALAAAAPDAALDLLRHLPPAVSLAQLDLRKLTERQPIEVVRLMLGRGDVVADSLDQVAHRLEPDQLVALVERGHVSASFIARIYERLRPVQRERIYAAFGQGLRDWEDCLDPGVVARLPRAARENEARRHLSLPVLQTRPTSRLAYAGFLPWDEAVSLLNPLTTDSDTEIRASAIGALVQAARYAPERLGEVLAVPHHHPNEPDPVRRQMLAALAQLPPGRWREEHLDGLSEVIQATIQAGDLSYQTGSAATLLLIALARPFPAWSADLLARLVRRRDEWYGLHGSMGPLENRLSDSEASPLLSALSPTLQEWASGDESKNGQLVGVARAFGRRLRGRPELAEALTRALEGTHSARLADDLLALLSEHYPNQLAQLMPRLLASDRSWITRPIVVDYLNRRRQDLLTPFLKGRPLKGRFGTGQDPFVLPLDSGFARWTSRQQQAFARTLYALSTVRDSGATRSLALAAKLAALPVAPVGYLSHLARDERGEVREATLRALGALDASQGVPVLLEALGDERGRVAVYALRGTLLEMAPDGALALLKEAPVERVAVAKEVVRLLGELETEDAYQELLRLARLELHRDVRAGLLRALWHYPEADETWPILEAAAKSDDRALANVVGRMPTDDLSDRAYGRLVSLLGILSRHADPLVRQAVLERCAERPIADPERMLLASLLASVRSRLPDERAIAAAAVVSTYGPRDPQLVYQAVRDFRADRRALKAIFGAVESAIERGTGEWVSFAGVSRGGKPDLLALAARAVIRALHDDPPTAGHRIALAIGILPWDEVVQELVAPATAGGLDANVLEMAVVAIWDSKRRPDRDGLERLEDALRQSPVDQLRRLALAALAASAEPPGAWDEARLARLREYRADPSPLVAGVAQFVLPASEVG